jgi:hypothetical protein
MRGQLENQQSSCNPRIARSSAQREPSQLGWHSANDTASGVALRKRHGGSAPQAGWSLDFSPPLTQAGWEPNPNPNPDPNPKPHQVKFGLLNLIAWAANILINYAMMDALVFGRALQI